MREHPRGLQGPGSRPREAKGGAHSHGTRYRGRHVVQRAETRGQGSQVVGVGDFQLDRSLCLERRWEAGARERVYT